MDFQGMSAMNLWMNLISGNLLPMTNDVSSFPLFWRLYGVITWLLLLTYMYGLISGFFYIPVEKIIKNGMISVVIVVEVSVIITRIYTQKALVRELIGKLNENLRVQDAVMQDVLTTTLRSIKAPLQFYWVAGVMATFVWSCLPLPLILQRNTFYYVDLQTPLVYCKEPYSTVDFVLINISVLISNVFIFIKKVAVDVYMTHLVLMITVQHLYTSRKLVSIFRDGNRQNNHCDLRKGYRAWADCTTITKLKGLCRHHILAINLTLMLKKLLSLNFSLIYVNSVFRFCSIAILIFAIPSTSVIEGLAVCTFACGEIVQLYILCSCVHKLLDASTKITDEAFHEDWYRFGPCVKRTFMLIIMASNVGFKLSTFERFNLSLPSFMAILNQSYSIALLILKMTRK
ncbi:uncharacterized protein LOC116842730 [Odontomachus brunneus]|uniref:uncharacterized protein LOC116842730 n=1 Tax=Odontomachus brunneus TaxID=486640 RepID=UPI0013F21670|nr:uncharacterized protein LOC116842730 [Odontomachus brunneus]